MRTHRRWTKAAGPLLGLTFCVLGIAAVIHWAPALSKAVEEWRVGKGDKAAAAHPVSLSLALSAKESADTDKAWKERYDGQIKERAIRQAQAFFLHGRPEKPAWTAALYGEYLNPFQRICADLEWIYGAYGALTYFYPRGIIPISWEEAGIVKEAAEGKMRAAGIALTKALVGTLAPDRREARKNAKPCNEGRESEWGFANAEYVMERATEVWDLTNTTPDNSGLLAADMRQMLLADFKADIRDFCEADTNDVKPVCEYPPALAERVRVMKNLWNFSDQDLGIISPQTIEEKTTQTKQTKIAH